MPPALSTERLVLRLLGTTELEPVHALFSDAGRTIGNGPVDDHEATLTWLERRESRYREQGLAWYGMRNAAGAFVGTCGVFTGERCGEDPEIGYEIGRQHRGKGFAREAALAVTGTAQDAVHPRVWATIRPANVASIRIVRSIGYRHVRRGADATGELDYYVSGSGGTEDV